MLTGYAMPGFEGVEELPRRPHLAALCVLQPLTNAFICVLEAEVNGCVISAGCQIRIEPTRVSLVSRPEDGFAIDARQWRRYRAVREQGNILIFVNGELKMKRP